MSVDIGRLNASLLEHAVNLTVALAARQVVQRGLDFFGN